MGEGGYNKYMQVVVLGLGKMGKSIAEKFMIGGQQVVVWNRSADALEKMRVEKAEFIISQHLTIIHSLAEIRSVLRKPRVIWSMLPAGEPTEQTLQQITEFVDPGDVVIDGGNAQFADTERRAALFRAKGVKFLGIGVSGGIHGFENGFSLMVGGDPDAYEYVRPILDNLVSPSGTHAYFGTGGAGHFVKMVHNGIEYGMMQAIAEGFGLLSKSNYQFDLVNVANTYQSGSIISSFLLDMVIDALSKDPTLGQTVGLIGVNGEGEWTVMAGKETHVPVDVIEKSLEFRRRSQYDKAVQQTFAAKLVQAMRHEFGGHGEQQTQ
jgi:6-phosphogluconate dehydrogenase